MKCIKLVFVIVLCCSLLTACYNNKNSETSDDNKNTSKFIYDSYVCDMTNDGLIIDTEKTWWNGISAIDNNALKNISLKFEESSFDCEYMYSRLDYLDWRTKNYYLSDDGITIIIDSIDQTICGFHKGRLTSELQMNDCADPYNEARKIAKQYASQYVDISKYSIEESDPYNYSHTIDGKTVEIPLYSFRFTKYVDDYPTSDRISVQITSKGTLRTLHINNIGAFDNIDLSILDSQKLDSTIDAKIRELYSNRVTTYSYTVEKNTLTYSPEGNLVIVSQIILRINNDYNTGVILATVIS